MTACNSARGRYCTPLRPAAVRPPTDSSIIRHISYSSLSDPTYIVLDIILPMLIMVKFRGALS